MVRKRKQRSTFHVVSFKLNDEDFRKVEQTLQIAKARGLKLNKAFVFAMCQYFNVQDCSEVEKEGEQKVEPKKEQSLEKRYSTFEQNSVVHKAENKEKVENLPSYFQNNPWLTILAMRK
jgi:hypothetical protein